MRHFYALRFINAELPRHDAGFYRNPLLPLSLTRLPLTDTTRHFSFWFLFAVSCKQHCSATDEWPLLHDLILGSFTRTISSWFTVIHFLDTRFVVCTESVLVWRKAPIFSQRKMYIQYICTAGPYQSVGHRTESVLQVYQYEYLLILILISRDRKNRFSPIVY